MIKSSNLKNLRIMDFFQVVSNISAHLEKYDLNALKLTDTATNLQTSLSELDEALKPLRVSGDTLKLNELDARRDRALVGLRAFLKSFSHFPDAAKTNAANKLKAELEKYGKSPQTLPLREETAMIHNILQDFAKPENAAFVTELGAATWITELQTTNTEFETLYNRRTQENAAIEVGRTKENRQKTQDALTLLIQTINARMLLDGEAPYKALADAINFEIKSAKTPYKVANTAETNGEKPAE